MEPAQTIPEQDKLAEYLAKRWPSKAGSASAMGKTPTDIAIELLAGVEGEPDTRCVVAGCSEVGWLRVTVERCPDPILTRDCCEPHAEIVANAGRAAFASVSFLAVRPRPAQHTPVAPAITAALPPPRTSVGFHAGHALRGAGCVRCGVALCSCDPAGLLCYDCATKREGEPNAVHAR